MGDRSHTLGAVLLIVALAALAASRFGGAAPVPASAAVEASTTSTKETGDSTANRHDRRHLEPLLDYLDVMAPDEAADDSLLDDLAERIYSDAASRELHFTADFLIATVPDPQLAGSDFLTDAMIETLRRAIEAPFQITDKDGEVRLARGPILDRYWLPWAKGAERNSNDGAGVPGMLVFRQTRNAGFVAVLVVGEHPALGVDRAALAKALHVVNRLQVPEKRTIRIVGPTFTGSQASLAGALSTFHSSKPPPKREYWIANGSASALDLEGFMEAALPAKPRFDSTVWPEDVLHDYLFRTLARPWPGKSPATRERVVVLVESGTGYGQKTATMFKKFEDDLDIAMIPFPMHISGVLSAYQSDQQQLTQKLPKLQSSGVKIGLPLKTEDMQYRRLQPYEPQLAAVRVDLLLREITRVVNERRVRRVGVVATSSLDKLFLASLVRRSCPDVRLYTTIGDVLLTHPDVSVDLTGMVVASTYPLYRANEDWSADEVPRLRMAFGHQSEQGVFNAVQLLLGHPESLLEYGPPLGEADQPMRRPPVWVSVVGRDAIYPVRSYDVAVEPPCVQVATPAGQACWPTPISAPASADVPVRFRSQYEADLAEIRADRSDPGPDLWWLGACTAMFVGSLYAAYHACFRVVRGPRVVAWFAPLAMAALAGFWFVAARLFRGVAVRWTYSGFTKVEIWVALVTTGAALAVLVDRAAFHRRGKSITRDRTRTAAGIGALVATVAYALALHESDALAVFDATRTVNLQGGVSPLLTLALLTFALVMLCSAEWRLAQAFSVQRRKIGGLSWALVGRLEDLRRAMVMLERRVRSPWRLDRDDVRIVDAAPFLAVLVLLAIPTAFDLFNASSVERPWHPRLVAVLYLAVVVLLSWQVIWLRLLWRRLHGVLLQLGDLPALQAFNRLPRHFGSVEAGSLFSWIRSNYGRLLTMLEQQLSHVVGAKAIETHGLSDAQRWRRLRSHMKAPIAELADKVWPNQSIEAAYGRPAAAAPAGKENAPETRRRELEVFVAAMLFSYLLPFLVQLRQLAWAVLLAVCALVLATWSYPFVPQTNLQRSAWLLALLVGFRFWRIATQLNRDEVMSRVTNTEPNRLTWSPEFTQAMLTYLGPLVALVLYSFFGLPQGVLEWLGGLAGR